jgi:hypothetical protein
MSNLSRFLRTPTDAMTIPTHLDGWTVEAVEALCAVGMGEGDRHDFKGNFQDAVNTTKVCCAFANTYGGFLIYGVSTNGTAFSIEGLDPNPEFMSDLRRKVNAEPEIEINGPKIISVPNSAKVLYIAHIPQSTRRPHLPSTSDRRYFWKRSGANCTQMTLEEIRSQMLVYEEKLEKLALMAFDLRNKAKTIEAHAGAGPGFYYGDSFQFDIVDRVVVEAYTLLKRAPDVLILWERLKQNLMLFNFEKEKLRSILANSYNPEFKNAAMEAYTRTVEHHRKHCQANIHEILRRLKELYDVEIP